MPFDLICFGERRGNVTGSDILVPMVGVLIAGNVIARGKKTKGKTLIN